MVVLGTAHQNHQKCKHFNVLTGFSRVYAGTDTLTAGNSANPRAIFMAAHAVGAPKPMDPVVSRR